MAKINGKIIDVNNEPLMGANVTLRSGTKAGKVGTVSDFNGNFSLESDSFNDSDLFEISYVGFVKQSFTAGELKNKNVVLKEALTELTDVVITGTRPKQISTNKQSKLVASFSKNKYVFAGIGGLLGLALIFVSIKKLK